MRSPSIDELPKPELPKNGWPWTAETASLPERMPDGQPWPRISVVTPSYNQGAFLEETIRSVLLQGYPDLEFIVIDGGSQDASIEIIRKYSLWLKYWVSEPDRGQSHAINKGWEMVTGDLIAYINSDDYYSMGAFEKVAQAWRGNPEVALIIGAAASIDESSRVKKVKKPFLHSSSPLDLSLLEPSAWYLPQQSTFFVREHLDRVERCMREDLQYTMDRELMYRICRQGRVLLIGDCLAADRAHPQSKRINQTLALYKEDALALSYCNWGDAKETVRRKQVARVRMAQGHYQVANRNPSRLKALYHFALAAYYRPAYLRSRNFLKTCLRSAGLTPQ